jgi:hypothetical protein
MAQIIKHRRGSLSQLKDVTARVGELVMATGSIDDLNGPVVFIGESEVGGGYRAISKIYQGTTAPTINVGSYGSTIDGTPFYSTGGKTLFILNKDGNIAMNLVGNIEGNTISNVTITTLTGSNASFDGFVSASSLNVSGNTQLEQNLFVGGETSMSGNLNITGNTIQTGSISLTGDVKLGGNIFIGDNSIEDIVVFTSNISSSIVPSDNNTFDIGSSENAWKDLYVSGTAYINNLELDGISVDNITLPGDLTVSGTTTLSGSVLIENLTETRIVVVGVDGELIDSADLTFNGTKLNIGEGNFEVDVTDGDIRTSGSFTVTDLNVTNDLTVGNDVTISGTTSMLGDLFVSGNVQFLGSATEVIISSSTVIIDDNIITLNAFSPFERYAGFEVMDSGSTGVSASLLWDSQNDYWMFVSSSGQSSKLIGTTAGTYGSEIALTINRIPKATGVSNIGDSLLSDNGTVLSYNTNKFTVDSDTGATLISGNVTLSSTGGTDNNNKTSAIVFRNSNNLLGYVSTTETTDVMDGILGYKQSNGGLVFSTVIDGGTY